MLPITTIILLEQTIALDTIIRLSMILRMTATIDADPRPEDSEVDSSDERSALASSIVAETLGAIRHFRCAGAERLTREGISIAHLHAMWLLQDNGELPMSRLADLLGVSLSNATGLVDRMEERGLVERVRVPDDRRLVLVRVTAHGVEVVETMDVFRRDILERLMSRLDHDQLLRLRQVVRDLTEALGDARGAAADGCTEASAALARLNPASVSREAHVTNAPSRGTH